MIIPMQPIRTLRWTMLVVPLLMLGLTLPARAQATLQLTAEVGYDSYIKENQWAPLRITLENNGEDIRGSVEARLTDDVGNVTIYSQVVDLPAGARKQLVLNVFISFFTQDITVEFRSANGALASVNVRMSHLYSTDQVYGILASRPSPYNVLADLDPPYGNAIVVPLEINDLPDQTAAWKTLDFLIISDIDTGSMSAAQREALSQWVTSGGHLFIVVDNQWQKTIAGLHNLLPFNPHGFTTLYSAEGLAAFAQSSVPLEVSSPYLATTGILDVEANVLIRQDDTPLVIRRVLGWGKIDLITIDPALAPLHGWNGMIDLYRAIFSPQVMRPGWSSGVVNWDATREVANTLPELPIPGSFTVLCFLGTYVLVLGPLNFYLLHKLKKRQWAWLTIPAIVLIFSISAIVIGAQLRGARPILNRMAIIQAWPDTGQAAVSGVVGIYSPRQSSVDVQIGEGVLVHTINGQYGVFAIDSTLQVSGEQLSMPDLHISAGETIPLVFETTLPSPSISSDLTLEISPAGVTLAGSLANHSQLSFTDAVLLYPGGTLTIGDFAPGQVQTVSVPLTRSQYMDDQYAQDTTISTGAYYPYSWGNFYWMPDTTFFDILGNSNYTDNPDDYRRYLLLNTHVANNQNSGRGSGIYLSGWVNAMPISITLAERPARYIDTSLYIFSLTPTIDTSGSLYTLSPGVFTYNASDDSAAFTSSPYLFTIFGSEIYDRRFKLAYPIVYSSVQRLEIHLGSSQAIPYPTSPAMPYPTYLKVSLWDEMLEQWVLQDIGAWGTYSVPDPSRYVNSSGEIFLRLQNTSNDALYIETADISLQVLP